jgi:hypothetical protein
MNENQYLLVPSTALEFGFALLAWKYLAGIRGRRVLHNSKRKEDVAGVVRVVRIYLYVIAKLRKLLCSQPQCCSSRPRQNPWLHMHFALQVMQDSGGYGTDVLYNWKHR